MSLNLKTVTSFIGLVLTVGVIYYFYDRNVQIDTLYRQASEAPLGSERATAATRELARYGGQRVNQLLLNIALGQTTEVDRETQSAAIGLVASRSIPNLSGGLASLLVPHKSIRTREAVASALQDHPCDTQCVLAVLHYLERIWRGEENIEDRMMSRSKLAPDIAERSNAPSLPVNEHCTSRCIPSLEKTPRRQ